MRNRSVLYDGAVHMVAIVPPPDGDSGLADRLAQAASMAMYETRTRLRVLAGWPGVLSTFAEAEHAHAVVAAIAPLGFPAWVMSGNPVSPRCAVRRFSLSEGMLSVSGDGGAQHQVELSAVRLLLAGRAYGVRTDVTVERGVAPVSFGRWIMGLPTATSPAAVQRQSETRDGFVHVYAQGHPTLVFAESSLQYTAAQLDALQPTRAANFARVVERLRHSCDGATFDDRLNRRRAQSRILGPTLRMERHLDVVIALLTRQLGAAANPYR